MDIKNLFINLMGVFRRFSKTEWFNFILVLLTLGMFILTLKLVFLEIPKISDKLSLIDIKQECYERSKKFIEENKNRCVGNYPQYTYSKKLNTCVFYDCYSRTNGYTEFIKDIFTNEVIVSHFYSYPDNLFLSDDEGMLDIEITPNQVDQWKFNKERERLFDY